MRRAALAAALALSAFPASAHAIVITETAWRAQGGDEAHWDQGFTAHEALADQAQFRAMVAISGDGGKQYGMASGVWIGNRDGFGYVLSAAHVFDEGDVTTFTFRSIGGTERRGVIVHAHPGWNTSVDQTGGADFAIAQLDGPIEDAGAAPVLYSGRAEQGRRAVLVGYGSRGVAPYGHGWRFGPHHADRKAAAENVIDAVRANQLSIDLDDPNGSGKNRSGDSAPISPLEGILAPGDSGGSLWIRADGGWRVAGVNSSGDPGADYQDVSNFARISTQRQWIRSVFPDARFAGDKVE
ncbi:MAG: serine protease [Hyphomonadaceae bacterium]